MVGITEAINFKNKKRYLEESSDLNERKTQIKCIKNKKYSLNKLKIKN